METQLLYEETQKLPEIFGQREIQKIVNTIETSPNYLKNDWGAWMRARDKAIFMTLYLLALRPREACALRFDDFNISNLTVKIRGENNKQRKDRILPIPQQLLNCYKEFFSFPRDRFWKESKYLFPSYQNPYVSSERWKFRFRNILKEAGLWKAPVNSTVPPYRSYTLRHTRATEVLEKTKDIFLVANILGHTRLSSTNIYLHKSKEYIEYMRKQLS